MHVTGTQHATKLLATISMKELHSTVKRTCETMGRSSHNNRWKYMARSLIKEN
jgi:hypothetical protein